MRSERRVGLVYPVQFMQKIPAVLSTARDYAPDPSAVPDHVTVDVVVGNKERDRRRIVVWVEQRYADWFTEQLGRPLFTVRRLEEAGRVVQTRHIGVLRLDRFMGMNYYRDADDEESEGELW